MEGAESAVKQGVLGAWSWEIGLAKAVAAASHLPDVERENASPSFFEMGNGFKHDVFHARGSRGSGADCAEF